MIVPPGFRPPTTEERQADLAKRYEALAEAVARGALSSREAAAQREKLHEFEGYPREIIKKRASFSEDPLLDLQQARLQEQMDRITRAFAKGLEEAAEKQIVASLRARGYLIARPADQLSDPYRKIAEQSRLIDVLRATIATLRAGGSVPPSGAEG